MNEQERAAKALQVIAGLGLGPEETREALVEALHAHDAFMGEYGAFYRWRHRVRGIAAVAAVALASVWIWEAAIEGHPVNAAAAKPIVWGHSRLAIDRIAPGEPLTVITTHKWQRACEWYSDRMFFDSKYHLVAMNRVNLAPIPVSPEFQRRQFKVETADLPIGEYVLRVSLHGVCGSDAFDYPRHFEQNFTIRPAG